MTTESAAVRAGWELVDLVERLGSGQAARLFADRWSTEARRGAEGYAPVIAGDLVDDGSVAMYESGTNLARFRRTIDFVQPGDRVLEIGTGRGYLGTRLLREGGAAAYLGLELLEENAAATRQTLSVNGYADAGDARVQDLYDLTRTDAEGFGADLVLCCEVIEHVPDPEKAVRVLADALPEAADLVITTPLVGRLETVWEHVGIFGVARLQAMLAEAGLTAHVVEPLANQWVVVLASRSTTPSARALRAIERGGPVARPAADEGLARTITNVPLDELEPVPSRWDKRLESNSVERVDGSLAVRLRATSARAADDTAGRYGGVAFATPPRPRGVRLELEPVDVAGATKLFVDFYAGPTRVGRWSWDLVDRPTLVRPTFVLRPGLKGSYFRPTSIGDLGTADRVELFAQLEAGGSAELRLHQLAWIT